MPRQLLHPALAALNTAWTLRKVRIQCGCCFAGSCRVTAGTSLVPPEPVRSVCMPSFRLGTVTGLIASVQALRRYLPVAALCRPCRLPTAHSSSGSVWNPTSQLCFRRAALDLCPAVQGCCAVVLDRCPAASQQLPSTCRCAGVSGPANSRSLPFPVGANCNPKFYIAVDMLTFLLVRSRHAPAQPSTCPGRWGHIHRF